MTSELVRIGEGVYVSGQPSRRELSRHLVEARILLGDLRAAVARVRERHASQDSIDTSAGLAGIAAQVEQIGCLLNSAWTAHCERG